MPTSKEEMQHRGLHPHAVGHSQHRRAGWQPYGGKGLYMVTLCTEGRQPCFGHLEGDIRARRASAAFPHIVLSELGRAVLEEELPKMHRFYPQVELWQVAVMPDHLHLLIRVREPLPKGKHLGHIISGFKGGCSRAWWALLQAQSCGAGLAASMGTAVDTAGTTAAAPAAPAATAPAAPATATAAVPAASAAVPSAAAPVAAPLAAPVAAPPPAGPPLFEPGYHDRIIKRPGMLENIQRYMADNPLRALMRRQLPHLLERRLHLRIGSRDYAAFGALFLLKRAEKEQVFFHRRDKATGLATELTEDYRQERERLLSEAREGVVLVSPAVSTPEKLVIDTALGDGLPVIHLQKEPIAQYWKPERSRFEACARGTLLILYPWELDGLTTDYDRFHRLNELAAEICATTDAVLMEVATL